MPWQNALPVCRATAKLVADATRGWQEERRRKLIKEPRLGPRGRAGSRRWHGMRCAWSDGQSIAALAAIAALTDDVAQGLLGHLLSPFATGTPRSRSRCRHAALASPSSRTGQLRAAPRQKYTSERERQRLVLYLSYINLPPAPLSAAFSLSQFGPTRSPNLVGVLVGILAGLCLGACWR